MLLLAAAGFLIEEIHIPSRLEPTVEDLLHSLQLTLALLRRDGDVVDLVAVQVGDTSDAR